MQVENVFEFEQGEWPVLADNIEHSNEILYEVRNKGSLRPKRMQLLQDGKVLIVLTAVADAKPATDARDDSEKPDTTQYFAYFGDKYALVHNDTGLHTAFIPKVMVDSFKDAMQAGFASWVVVVTSTGQRFGRVFSIDHKLSEVRYSFVEPTNADSSRV